MKSLTGKEIIELLQGKSYGGALVKISYINAITSVYYDDGEEYDPDQYIMLDYKCEDGDHSFHGRYASDIDDYSLEVGFDEHSIKGVLTEEGDEIYSDMIIVFEAR